MIIKNGSPVGQWATENIGSDLYDCMGREKALGRSNINDMYGPLPKLDFGCRSDRLGAIFASTDLLSLQPRVTIFKFWNETFSLLFALFLRFNWQMREEDLYETGIVSLSQFKSSGQIVMYRFYTVRLLRYLVCVVCLYLKVRFKLQSLPTLQADKENTKQNTSDS
jgi:hypothetical protein